jgi:hypothetical protein
MLIIRLSPKPTTLEFPEEGVCRAVDLTIISGYSYNHAVLGKLKARQWFSN